MGKPAFVGPFLAEEPYDLMGLNRPDGTPGFVARYHVPGQPELWNVVDAKAIGSRSLGPHRCEYDPLTKRLHFFPVVTSQTFMADARKGKKAWA